MIKYLLTILLLVFSSNSFALTNEQQNAIDQAYSRIFSTSIAQQNICKLLEKNEASLFQKITGVSLATSYDILQKCGSNISGKPRIDNLPAVVIKYVEPSRIGSNAILMRGWSNGLGDVVLVDNIKTEDELVLILSHELAIRLNKESHLQDAYLSLFRLAQSANCSLYGTIQNPAIRYAIAALHANIFESQVAVELGINVSKNYLSLDQQECLSYIENTSRTLLQDKMQLISYSYGIQQDAREALECTPQDRLSESSLEADLKNLVVLDVCKNNKSPPQFYIPELFYKSGPGPRGGEGW